MPTRDQSAGPSDAFRPTVSGPAMKPGDEAPAGSPGTGETVCRRCGGSGKAGDSVCPDCQGTGFVTAIVGGA